MEGSSTEGGVAPEPAKKQPRKLSVKRGSEQFSNKGKSPMMKRRRFTNHLPRARKNSKLRLGGSLSDPLNLEAWSDDNECSTCAPSPDRKLGDQSHLPLPKELHDDPLNLQEKITDFQMLVENFKQINPVNNNFRNDLKDKRKRKRRPRKKSRSESSTSVSDINQVSHTPSATTLPDKLLSDSKSAVYRYGNYDRYYGYRNNGSLKDDPRLALFEAEWFKGKDCLDIGSNTGQVTMEIARRFNPKFITGIDIDSNLVRTACKNHQRLLLPTKLPDGRFIPKSIMMSFGPMDWVTNVGRANTEDNSSQDYPNNINFIQGNYVPTDDEDLCHTMPEYDVILCLSVTKWVHLNWGDEALKRMFKKMHMNLRPGGRLILEPQPWTSYGKKKKLSAQIFENYQKIKFLPDQFHSYLMSSTIGFTHHQYLGTSNNTSPGFQRPIHVYFKGATPTDKPRPNKSSDLVQGTTVHTESVIIVKPHPPPINEQSISTAQEPLETQS